MNKNRHSYSVYHVQYTINYYLSCHVFIATNLTNIVTFTVNDMMLKYLLKTMYNYLLRSYYATKQS